MGFHSIQNISIGYQMYACIFFSFASFQQSGDSWMYPYQRTPSSKYGKSLYKPYITRVFMGKLSPRIPRLNTINPMVVHVRERGTPVLIPWSN